MGFAYGPSGQCPESGSVDVWDKKEPIEIGCGRASRWLVRHIREFTPEMVGIEHPQSSGGLRSGRGNARATDSQLCIFGALQGVLGVYGLPAASPYPPTIRKMVCGRGFAPEEFDPVKKKMVPGDTKAWVARNMIMLGWLPRDFDVDHGDRDRSDAVAGFGWMSAVYGRAALPLVLRA